MRQLILTILLSGLITGCTGNIFKETANKTSDAAVFYDAKRLLDQKHYADVVAQFESLSASYRATNEVRFWYASALAGQCGYEFVHYVQTLDEAFTHFFVFAMSRFTGQATVRDSCKKATTELSAIIATNPPDLGSYALFMSLLSLAKMGAVLHEAADKDGEGGLGDGIPDGTFDTCKTTSVDNGIDDDDMRHIVSGFASFIQNFSRLSEVLSGGTVTSIDATLAQITANCGFEAPDPIKPLLPVPLQAAINPCAATDPAAVTTEEIFLFRSFLAELQAIRQIGMGACDSSALPLDVFDCCPVLRNALYGM